jgi:hypothetical protein
MSGTLTTMHPTIAVDPAETTEPGSAYPADVDDLLPRARVLAESVGEVPSRNRLMAELRIGAPKAKILRGLLAAEAQSDAAEPDPDPIEPTGSDEPATEPTQTVDKIQASDVGHPGTPTAAQPVDEQPARRRPVSAWPLLILAAPAFVAIWSGWVGLGGLTGFGVVHPLPGIAPRLALNTAITLPIGVEAYAAYALRAWLTPGAVPVRARRFARWSAIGSLALGAAGQVAYHLMVAAGITAAPWPVTTAVACLPVAVLGMGAALAHLLRADVAGSDFPADPATTEEG